MATPTWIAEASKWFERSHPIFDKFADRVGTSFYYRGIGDVALAQQDYPLARDNFAKSAELARTAKHAWMLIYALNGLGRSELAMNHLDLARQHFNEALEISSRVRDKGIALVVLAGLAQFLADLKKRNKPSRWAPWCSIIIQVGARQKVRCLPCSPRSKNQQRLKCTGKLKKRGKPWIYGIQWMPSQPN